MSLHRDLNLLLTLLLLELKYVSTFYSVYPTRVVSNYETSMNYRMKYLETMERLRL